VYRGHPPNPLLFVFYWIKSLVLRQNAKVLCRRSKPIKQAVCDRGYVGAKVVLGANIILTKKAIKRDNRYQQAKKRNLCKSRAAIEPIIGHLLRRLMILMASLASVG
jgi:hypothetical protein